MSSVFEPLKSEVVFQSQAHSDVPVLVFHSPNCVFAQSKST